MSLLAPEIGKVSVEGISSTSQAEVSVKEIAGKFEVSRSRIEYPSDFEEPPDGYNPYDGFANASEGEFVRGGKIDNLTEMLNADPTLQESGELWTKDSVKNIFDDYSKADPKTRSEIVNNLTDALNADPKLQEMGELWNPKDVKEVFFDSYSEEQEIKDLHKAFEI